MRRLALLVAALSLLSGCDCDRCAERSGEYQLSFKESGLFDSCVDPIPRQEVAVPFDPPPLPGHCNGTPVVSDDNCSVVYDLYCGNPAVHAEHWEVDFSCDGESGEGTVSFYGGECLFGGSYDVSFEKL